MKFNSTGVIEWQKRYGGGNYDQAMSIDRTQDGGYVFAGRSASPGTNGGDDVWVVKLDKNGTQQWQSFMGGSYSDVGHSIRQTPDGGYIVAGDTTSKDIETAGNDVGGIYVARLNPSGTVLWQRAIGGSGSDYGSSIIPSVEGYILAGFSDSTDFGADQRKGADDVIVMKLDETGEEAWMKGIGGIGFDRTGYDNAISPAPGGGYILTAQSTSGDIADNHGSYDALVVRLNGDGTVYEQNQKKWLKMYGGSHCEVTGSVIPLTDGGYMLTSMASSGQSGDISEKNHGEHDIWVVRLDADGKIVWQRLLGGNRWDQSTSIRETSDGGYIFAGFTQSSDSGYIGTSHGYEDAWVVKLNPGMAVDVLDADTKMWVPNVTVTLHDVARNEDQTLSTLINGRVIFSDSGINHQYKLLNGSRYTIKASAEYYRNSTPVDITYSGDGQRVIINLTPLIANYTKSFSITCIEHYDNICGKDGICSISGTLDECDYVASALSEAGYKMNFYHKDGEVTEKDFATDSSYSGNNITESAFHYHSGHGSSYLDDHGKWVSLVQLKGFNYPDYITGWNQIRATDVKNEWGGQNKWVAIQSCKILQDENWWKPLKTSHGILGYSTSIPVNSSFSSVFLSYSLNKTKNMTISSAYKQATRDTWYDDNVTAVILTKTKKQYENDQFPGIGYLESDGDPNSTDYFIKHWKCRSDLEW
ncbi:hypothetical protein [Methanoregula sp. PtaU1.Bin006]|uniref:hypothetical protein n=1 Tax=Methanoregula sp. PtaU1.Bin006 TaxID=1811681 RepID=UPI0025E2593B|nr:hypothetical protein [Methanoregula sp. PtaU1.Bin006]